MQAEPQLADHFLFETARVKRKIGKMTGKHRVLRVDVPPRGSFFAHVTAVHPDAPPILQWDRADKRNPVSRYTYHGGSSSRSFGLDPGLAVVTGIVINPAQWFDSMSHHDSHAVLLLAGARDETRYGSLALFPETLRAELREVRSVIEAHSRSKSIERTDGPNAAGLSAKGSIVLATDKLGVTVRYLIDRWS